MPHKRKLAAILSADVVGYSRLMGDDERATVSTLRAYRDIFAEHITAHDGRVVDSPGDALLAEFPSAVEAVDSAVDIQTELAGRNASLPEHRRMRFRVGINVGGVSEEAGALYGDGVNIAARLESLAEPGGICVSGTVYDQVAGKLSVSFKFTGEQSVKNIAKPVRAYNVLLDSVETRSLGKARTRLKWAAVSGAFVVAVATIVAAVAWYAARAPTSSTHDLVLAMPRGPTVAVLPFTNLGGDPGEDYFADGLTEDIITELARFQELNVLARNTTFQFKGGNVDVPAVGHKLGAQYVLEGSARKSGDRVRISAQLIDARSGAHIWAERYDRDFEDIFAVQDEIADEIAAAIAGGAGGVVIRAGRDHSISKPTSQLDAYDLVLRATAAVPGTAEDKETATRNLEYLKKAIALDPTYARARAEHAFRRIRHWAFLFDRSISLEEITREAEVAIKLDRSDPMAHRTAAFAYYFSKRLELFNREARAALELAPNNAELLAQLGALYTFSGNWDLGVNLVTKANKLNAVSAAGWYHSALHYDFFQKGRFQQALDIVTLHPGQDQLETQWKYAAAYGALGNSDKALEHWKQCLELDASWSKAKLEDVLRMWNFPESFIRSYIDAHTKGGIAD